MDPYDDREAQRGVDERQLEDSDTNEKQLGVDNKTQSSSMSARYFDGSLPLSIF
jgi:hypothetical protein